MKHLSISLMLFVLLALLVAPVVAQDATPDVQPVEVVETPAPEFDPIRDGQTGYGIIAIFVTGALSGALFSAAGIIAAIRAVKSDPEKLALIERLYDSRPDTQKELIRKGVEVGKVVVSFADEVTDGLPSRDKPDVVG